MVDSVAACLLPFFRVHSVFQSQEQSGFIVQLKDAWTGGADDRTAKPWDQGQWPPELFLRHVLWLNTQEVEAVSAQIDSVGVVSVCPTSPPCQVQKSFKREASRDLDGPVAPLPAHSRPLSDYLAKTAKNKSQSLNLNFPKKKKEKNSFTFWQIETKSGSLACTWLAHSKGVIIQGRLGSTGNSTRSLCWLS